MHSATAHAPPRTHACCSRSAITELAPETLGEHIRKRRFELALTLKQAAAEIGVTESTVINWEQNRTEPPVTAIPAVVRFLGYDPFPSPTTLAERLLAKRRAMGWTIKRAAESVGVDPGTWRDWEAGKAVRYRKQRAALTSVLGFDERAEALRTNFESAGDGRPETFSHWSAVAQASVE